MHPLVHIGYHKTGTSFLQRRVFCDESSGFSMIAGSPQGEGPVFVGRNPFGFDAQAVRDDLMPKIRQAHARNLVPVISYERLSGSPYAGGFDSRQTADRIVQTLPEARILIVIREQASMLGSIYKQYVRRGGAAALEQFVSPPLGGASGMPTFRFDFYEYHRLVGYYQRLFGVENVLALPYELLQNQRQDFFARIGGFLGMPAATPKDKKLNSSPSALALAFKRQANRLVVRDGLNPAPLMEIRGSNPVLLKACRRIDRSAPTELLEGYERLWRRRVERKVGKRYAESNAITSELIGIELRELGYP